MVYAHIQLRQAIQRNATLCAETISRHLENLNLHACEARERDLDLALFFHDVQSKRLFCRTQSRYVEFRTFKIRGPSSTGLSKAETFHVQNFLNQRSEDLKIKISCKVDASCDLLPFSSDRNIVLKILASLEIMFSSVCSASLIL